MNIRIVEFSVCYLLTNLDLIKKLIIKLKTNNTFFTFIFTSVLTLSYINDDLLKVCVKISGRFEYIFNKYRNLEKANSTRSMVR